MLILIVILISIFQLGIYYLIQKKSIAVSKTIVLIIILLGYYFILPKLFYPPYREDGINCGNPIFAINFAFWFFGTIGAFSTHFIWSFWIKRKQQ